MQQQQQHVQQLYNIKYILKRYKYTLANCLGRLYKPVTNVTICALSQ